MRPRVIARTEKAQMVFLTAALLAAALILPMVPGAWTWPVIVRHMNQRVFEGVALALAVAAAVKLMLF